MVTKLHPTKARNRKLITARVNGANVESTFLTIRMNRQYIRYISMNFVGLAYVISLVRVSIPSINSDKYFAPTISAGQRKAHVRAHAKAVPLWNIKRKSRVKGANSSFLNMLAGRNERPKSSLNGSTSRSVKIMKGSVYPIDAAIRTNVLRKMPITSMGDLSILITVGFKKLEHVLLLRFMCAIANFIDLFLHWT
jgi:hypothetical protein